MAFVSFKTPVAGRSGRIISADQARLWKKLMDNPKALLRCSKKRQEFILNIKCIHGSQSVKLPDYVKPTLPGSAVYDDRYR